MTDQQIIQALIARDEGITRHFFFTKCRPLFLSIMSYVFSYEVDYDEFVSEFYLYLMENDAHKLRHFQGRSSLYQWMKIVAIRYFIAKRNRMIEDQSQDALLEGAPMTISADNQSHLEAKMDLQHLLSLMTNQRYVYVIQRLVLQDADPQQVACELDTNVANLYNIKKRAIASLTEVALKEARKYEK